MCDEIQMTVTLTVIVKILTEEKRIRISLSLALFGTNKEEVNRIWSRVCEDDLITRSVKSLQWHADFIGIQ